MDYDIEVSTRIVTDGVGGGQLLVPQETILAEPGVVKVNVETIFLCWTFYGRSMISSGRLSDTFEKVPGLLKCRCRTAMLGGTASSGELTLLSIYICRRAAEHRVCVVVVLVRISHV